ncbi:sporulation membrane protein YtrI [Ornithinibacillus halophilus]|uniref:Sporulation membrane protein YtrI C-terminal domain-containing protein n=1 Tax=Ornithinibacillus halophilus TaxID=930117 RepID=A0A1M5EH24_9BACI|nr:sporulation membrane protein YtrI [Ornithinibacillus halophilus]SHF78476.1 hypothetical protein SAMN05216225_100519 [Ornithinibacillus halophilus]
MHIPPYYKKPGWQRFFVGVFFGGLISYFVVIYMYGSMYGQLLEENTKLDSELKNAEKRIETLEENNANLDEQSKKPIAVEEIEMTIVNAEQLKLDSLITHQLEELVKEEVDQIIGEDVNIVTESSALIISSIENKNFKVDDFSYAFEVKQITIAKQVKIVVEAELSN